MDKLKTFKYYYVDDFISKDLQDKLEKDLLTNEVPYYYNQATTNNLMPGLDKSNFKQIFEKEHFVHTFVSKGEKWSNNLDIVRPLIRSLPEKDELYRVKANLMLQDKNGDPNTYNTPHYDFTEFAYYIALYYVNDSDGYTFLFDEDNNIMDRIQPKKGRMVFMRGDVLHASRHPIKYKHRLVINMDIMAHDNRL